MRLLSLAATLVFVSLACADQPKLTTDQVSALTAPVTTNPNEVYDVEIAHLGKIDLSPGTSYRGTLTKGKEFIYPRQYDPAKTYLTNGIMSAMPSFPKDFISVNIEWTIRLHGKRVGSIITIDGEAKHTEFKGFVEGGHGALSGFIRYKNSGADATRNSVLQPVFQSTVSNFYLTAIPGESYDVPLYIGTNATNYSIKVIMK